MTYEWIGNEIKSNSSELQIEQTGSYEVTVTTPNGCVKTTSINLENVSCLIPKGISPNNDGLNDSFLLSNLLIDDLKIFNRYGTEVYTYGKGYKNEWKGRDNRGNELPSGTYFYVIHTSQETLTGWVQLVR